LIPDNIKKEHIEQAIAYIDESSSVPPNRISRKYLVEYNGNKYPPKYVISIASKFANGQELDPSHFTGGRETNTFLIERGFIIGKLNEDVGINHDNDIAGAKRKIVLQHSLTVQSLNNMRSQINQLLLKIEGLNATREKMSHRINRLTREDKIPRTIRPSLLTITEMRNAAEYDGYELCESDINAVRGAWNAIKNWATDNGYSMEEID
jgi:hypothetical protein